MAITTPRPGLEWLFAYLRWIARTMPRPAFRGGFERRARADYFVSVRENYDAAARRPGYQASAAIQAILNRAPALSSGLSSDRYRDALGNAISWSDCFALERETIAAAADFELGDRLRSLRIRYAQIASADEIATYTKTALDLQSGAGVTADRLRAELGAVAERIEYLLVVAAPKEHVRASLTLWTIATMLGGMIVVVGTFCALWLWRYGLIKNDFVPTDSLSLVLFAGLAGGFVSVLQRLQQPSAVDPTYKRIELEQSGLSIVASPIIGMIFACVFFVITLAGVIDAGVFPKFACFDNPHCSQHDLAFFAASATPDSAASWAKLALWSFAAGFLERLVPDILTRLGSVATNAKI